ncbi:MAG: serine hydrolase [Mucilaginibacter sp.]|nr:serine hydrolase [Mucilaginibacter sp.]
MNLKIIALLLCAASLQAVAQQSSVTEDPRFKGLDTAFLHVLKTWHAAGFAVAVIEKNKVVYAKGFGYRDIAGKLPVTPNTLFAIGSCSKAFTAALIGKLQQDGKLDIDKPVTNYLPSLKFYNDAMNNTITLRDMMSHRTGLPRHDLSWYFFNSPSTDSLIQRVQYMEPTFGVRQKWQYNNFMFAAQGDVVEKLTGKSWEENIKEKFFIPLGMTRSDVSIPEMEKTEDAALGYGLRKDTIIKKLEYYHINGMAPAGAINSSVNDMAKWVTAWINNGKYNGKEIIPARHRDEAISSQSIIDAALPGKEKPDIFFANYGFGWFLASYKGHYMVEHGGNIDGFSASTCFFPSDSVAIVVLANQDGSTVPSIVRNLVADRMLNLKYFDWNGDRKKAADKGKEERDKLKKETTPVAKHYSATHPLGDFAGNYQNPGYGTLKIRLVKDSLLVKTFNNTIWLRHNTYDIFDVFDKDIKDGVDTSEAPNLKIQFQMDLAGDINGLTAILEAGLKPILFTKQIAAKPLTANELQKYVGEYELAGIVAKVYLKEKTLYLFVPGQPEYETIPMGNDKFSIKNLSGYYLQFGPPGEAKITEATFIQPNGSFKAKRK